MPKTKLFVIDTSLKRTLDSAVPAFTEIWGTMVLPFLNQDYSADIKECDVSLVIKSMSFHALQATLAVEQRPTKKQYEKCARILESTWIAHYETDKTCVAVAFTHKNMINYLANGQISFLSVSTMLN